MKKLTVGLAALLSGYAAQSFAALPTGVPSRCDVTVPNFCGSFTFGLTGMYWRASSPEVDFGTSFPNTTVFTNFQGSTSLSASTFNGTSNNLRHTFNWAWSANIGYIFPCSGKDVNLTYTHYNHSRNRNVTGFEFPTFLPLSLINVTAPFIFTFPIDDLMISGKGIDTGTGSAPFTFTGTCNSPTDFTASFNLVVNPDDITNVCARSNFENNTWDLDFGQTVNVGCNLRLRYFGGLRYTRLRHTLDANINAVGSLVIPTPIVIADGEFNIIEFNEPSTATTTAVVTSQDVSALVSDIVNAKSDFNGIGPRFGLTGDYRLGCGFGVIGSLSTSLLVGRVEDRFRTFIDVTPVVPITGQATVGDFGDSSVIITPPVSVTASSNNNFAEEFLALCFNRPNDTRVVPNIDAKLGLDWTYQFCNCSHSRLTIEAGYMVSHYFNPIDRVSIVDAVAPEFCSRHTLDIDFDGPYVSVQVAL